MVSILLLAACGNNTETTEPLEEERSIEEISVSDFEVQEDETTDPMIVGSKSEDVNTIASGVRRHTVQAWYVNEDTDEEGFNIIDFNGYTLKFSLALIKDEEGQLGIGMFGETENGTSETIQFNNETEVVTGTQEQGTFSNGLTMNTKPNVKESGFAWLDLENGTPESITLYMQAPLIEDEDGRYRFYTDEEETEIEFTIEE